jgi:transglutaminase-like putative cysteine protease
MTRRAREIETLLLTMFAAVPLYFNFAMGVAPVMGFHAAMAAIVVRVAMGKGPELIPARLMRWMAFAYVPFYFIDWRMIGGTAIAASTHLVLFIAVYQPIESLQRDNQAQRMLTTALIFVASLATSTHITVVIFVVIFAFLMFRQLMYVSHLETVRSVERTYAEAPSGRAAGFYLVGSMLIGALLFPLLPRVRNPFMSGFAGPMGGGSSSLSETINLRDSQLGASDGTVVARVWVTGVSRQLFTPIRLRGMIYDRFEDGEWRQTSRGLREVPSREGLVRLGRANGATGEAIVQQRTQRGKLYLPVGTYAMTGMPSRLYEGPTRDAYYAYFDGPVNLTTQISQRTEPLRLTRVAPANYPVTPEVAALAQRIVGGETSPERRAALIERYMVKNFRYVAKAADSEPISIEDFLLRNREGHCEYFAAGMVALLTALDVPARIAGGYYGGRYNPLTDYYAMRREDAHAWTEVWDGARWVTFDSTPPALRPGTTKASAVREYLAAVGDSLTFAWDRYVLTYGLGDQVSLAETAVAWTRETIAALRAGVRNNLRQIASPSFLGWFAALIACALAIALRNGRRRPLFHVLSAHLARRGIEVGPAMTMEEALQRLRVQHPDAARELEPLIAMYEEERFSARQDRARAAKIRRRLAELRA